MHIKNIFAKDITRPINGVVKADQLDDAIVWQELDEFVVTKELTKHFQKFFGALLASMDNPNDPVVASQMAVWISGFFGSGKSHFLKILSYLLKNYKAINVLSNETRKTIDFFEEKLGDAMLLGEMRRAVQNDDFDVILCNIDSKADKKDTSNAILGVFLRVFNEMQGYCGNAPHVAQMERYLENKGVLQNFHEAFREASGEEWEKERDAYLFMRDEVIAALAKALEMSEESAGKWFDEAAERFDINIEGFAKLVKDYLDSKGPNHRIAFLVDEVGQFIGSDTSRMLNLQTIVEDLGRVCYGRAWVIVTSQEDIEAVLGEVRAAKAHDFSKIQGRFRTRLSMSGANTDEVIQARLLEKTGDARRALEELWQQKGDILKNQISFTGGAVMKGYTDEHSFEMNYPFAPYHFQLMQKIFESIRKAGATGMHLSRGERSMLDAFQSAAVNVSAKEIGVLVPLYEFYPAIESFLDTIVKMTIDQADENPALEPFDTKILRVLFLIRYVETFKPNVDNLVTLCIDQVDADRLMLKRQIEESLDRLEKQNLINSNGDLYFFLTNEEQDVTREIKKVEITGNEQVKGLSELIFSEVLKDENKVRYQVNKRDYGYNRYCDGQVHGTKVDFELTVDLLTPLNDEYQSLDPARCIMRSTANNGCVVVRLPDNRDFFRELLTYHQTDKYIRLKSDASAPDTLKRILKERAEQNRERKGRLLQMVDAMLLEADFFACGQSYQVKANNSRGAVAEAMSYLVGNTYSKLGFLKVVHDEPQKEITALLRSNDIGQQALQIAAGDANDQALKEVRQYVDLATSNNQKILLDILVNRFTGRPYGWPEWEVVFLVAKLFVAGELNLMVDGNPLAFKDAVDPLLKSVKWKQVTVLKRKAVGEAELKSARNIAQDVFSVIGPETEDQLGAFLRENLNIWQQKISSFKPLAQSGKYPGIIEITEGDKTIRRLVDIQNNFEFFDAFIKAKDDLKDLSDDMQELNIFYTTQKPVWDKLQASLSGDFKDNREELVKDAAASAALQRMGEILQAPRPYGMLKEVEGLIATVDAVNEKCVLREREGALKKFDELIEKVTSTLDQFKASGETRNKALKPLQDLRKLVSSETSIPKMHYLRNKASEAVEVAVELIEEAAAHAEPVGGGGDVTPKPAAKAIKQVSASSFSKKIYLETEEDVEEYLAALKKELLAAVQQDMRIKIK